MTLCTNEHGQPIGPNVPAWTPCARPNQSQLTGWYASVERLDPAIHADDLFAAFATDTSGAMWTYMPNGPFTDRAVFDAFLAGAEVSTDPLFYAIINQITGRAEGFASFLRIDPAVGSIEVGFIAMSPLLQKTRVATEAMYLMMAHAMDDLGYRRYEWKCDTLNSPSKRAADRYGFTAEGVFRQATMYKGRNRDTAWFSILDGEWPAVRAGFLDWLDSTNFDADGVQKTALMTRTIPHT
ncbi:MAG: RimJ/RimL family protein N-acetyltransferase [Yoonia sp.]|jgi:RimJ/RimL family protein N-acetyltransferase